MSPSATGSQPLQMRAVAALWWPLAASWLMMSLELPLLTAVVGRMADATVHLAAYGSLVFPIALVIEGPIIMLLAASVALCKDRPSYQRVHRFMVVTSAALTALHVLVAFTPLFDFVAEDLIGAPAQILEPGRIGLRIMTPWTGAIAYRRFQQGVLIRFGRSRDVGTGTIVRLGANAAVLFALFHLEGTPGIVAGTCAIATGVSAEALYIGWRVRPVLRERLLSRAAGGEVLTTRAFLRFYLPLALTPMLTLLIQPLGASAMSRMPDDLSSLAAWPAVHGLVFILRSFGFAYNEVVVALLDRPAAAATLRRFALVLGATTTGALALLAATPLGAFWFGTVYGLEPHLAAVSHLAIAYAILMPGYQALQSWYQGALVHYKRPRAISEAVVIYLIITSAGLATAVKWDAYTGIYCAVIAFSIAGILQTLWLRLRASALLRAHGAARPERG